MAHVMKWSTGFGVLVVAAAITASSGLAKTASQAGREVKTSGVVTDWTAARFVVKDDSGKIHDFKIDRTTSIEGRPQQGSKVEVVSLQEGPLALRVKVMSSSSPARVVTVVGVIKSWSAEKVTLDVSGKLIDFRMAGDFAKLQEGPLAKPVGRKVRVTYKDDDTARVKTATSVAVEK